MQAPSLKYMLVLEFLIGFRIREAVFQLVSTPKLSKYLLFPIRATISVRRNFMMLLVYSYNASRDGDPLHFLVP